MVMQVFMAKMSDTLTGARNPSRWRLLQVVPLMLQMVLVLEVSVTLRGYTRIARRKRCILSRRCPPLASNGPALVLP